MRMKFACLFISCFIFSSFSRFVLCFPSSQFLTVLSVTPILRANCPCHCRPYRRRPMVSRSDGVIFYLGDLVAVLAARLLAVAPVALPPLQSQRCELPQ